MVVNVIICDKNRIVYLLLGRLARYAEKESVAFKQTEFLKDID